jgi:MFS superfamily sulfate permease-like transporter
MDAGSTGRILRTARLDRGEVSGSLGDLGTFLPLLVGMSAQNGLDFASALFFAGLFHVVTGLLFAIPMAVQPMKAIAAVALTEGLTAKEIVAAGMAVSAIVLLLGITGLVDWLDRRIPRPVVRGIQLCLGLSLAMKGVEMIAGTRVWLAPDSYATGIAGALVVLTLLSARLVPAALVLFLSGIGLALWKDPGLLSRIGVDITWPSWAPPAWRDFARAVPLAAIPQIPLTTFNSVIAVCALSADLFPDRPARPRRVACSVGVMNLIGGWFGAMPMCHGAGGLAGHYRFGARTNGSILFLGAALLAASVLFGSSLVSLCAAFPASLLGVMLAFSGLELALVARDQSRRRDAFVMLATAGAGLALKNIALGFAIGLGTVVVLRLTGGPREEEPA